MARSQVVDPTVICQSFPETPRPEIARDNILSTIETIFQSDIELVAVEGQQGIGKTTLLAQFARRHPDHTLSLFVRPTSRWACDPGILRLDLCNQLQWVLHQEELQEPERADDSFLGAKLFELGKRARYEQCTFYFVLDGLEEILEDASHARDLILDMMPFGHASFRFLLSGDSERLSTRVREGVRVKSFPLPGFTLDQTIKYLQGLPLALDQPSIEEIFQTCQGVPGHLASIRRIIQSRTDVQTLLEELPEKLPGLFEIEWRRVKADDPTQQHVLAILAHDSRVYSVDDLARILDVEASEILGFLPGLGFLTTDPEGREVSFVSEPFRRFASDQLRHLEDKVNELLVSDLNREPDSVDALTYLPAHLEKAQRFGELLSFLSPDHLAKMMEHSQSLSPVQQMADLGLRAARVFKSDGDLVRFSLQKAVMTELEGADVWRSEVEARMALDDYDAALALAQSTILREDRLHLLAVIAKAKRERGLEPEPELAGQIQRLCDEVDPTALGEKAVEIASDLVYSRPDLAIKLVERATDSNTGENAIDWAFAKLSIAALGVHRGQLQPTEDLDNIRSRIQDPKARHFSAAVSVLLGEYSADQVIAEVERLESTGDRLILLRQWAMDNRERADTAEVVDYALKLAIGTTEYAPNARVLRELATPLSFMSDNPQTRQIVGIFDSQKDAVEHLGPTEDYVSLQLLLAQTESRYDFEVARNRVTEVYLYVADIDDLSTKSTCMARLLASLADIDPEKRFQQPDELHTLVEDELKSYMKNLLDSSAEHYHAARGVIRALAKARPELALDFIEAVNTEHRRDLGLLCLIKSAIQVPPASINLPFIESVVDRFALQHIRDEAVMQVITRLSRSSGVPDSLIPQALPLINRLKDIQSSGERCRACYLAYSMLKEANSDEYSGLLAHLLNQLTDAWEGIDVGWHKVDIGFKVSESLASHSLQVARARLKNTEEYRDQIELDASTTAWTYLACVRLAIKSCSGLLAQRLDTKKDFKRLDDLIDRVPSRGERASLWADLALRCYADDRPEDCKRIVGEHVKPLLQDVSFADVAYRAKTLRMVAPALYVAHGPTALEMIAQLPLPYRDEALANICEFIIRKVPPSDPEDASPRQGYRDVTYEEITDICELLKQMDHDGTIYSFIEHICDAVVARRSRDRYPFTLQHKLEIARRLEEVISNKLPNPRHIKHDGYKIAAQAQVARIKRAKSQTWLELIDSARDIPNLADRALVLSIIAAAMPSKESSRRTATLEEAKEIVEQIPVDLDRIERYEALASMTLDIDQTMCRECLKSAMESAVKNDESDLYPVQRRIIDLAYKVDEDFAASLASLADRDPAREKTRRNLKTRLQTLDLKKRMADQLFDPTKSGMPFEENYPQAAWMLLGALNAGRINAVPIEHSRDHVQSAARLPLSESYPILAWAIQNAIIRHKKTPQAQALLRPLFEATLSGADLAARMASLSSMQLQRAKRYRPRSSDEASILIPSGDREYAVQTVREWVESKVRHYLKICDPYFGPDDLEVLRFVLLADPTCKVQILTSRKHHKQEGILDSSEKTTYRVRWRQITDHDPPDTEVFIVGLEPGGELPLHDRWWLTSGGGIRIGTSFSALGVNRDSEISFLSQDEAKEREAEVNQYLQERRKDHNGRRLTYTMFTLW